MPLPRPLCTRLPPDVEAELASALEAREWGPSEGLRSVVREWLATQRFRWIEFRDTALGRRAALRDGPEVWEVAMVAGEELEVGGRLTRHFARVPPEALEEALRYAAEQRDEIGAIVERNRRLARMQSE